MVLIVINNKNGNIIDLDSILLKGWDEPEWIPEACTSLPCTIKLPSIKQKEQYTLIQVKSNGSTKEQSIEAKCKDYTSIEIKKLTLNNKKETSLSHPTNCKFYDVPVEGNWAYKYVTALCSAGIIKGYNNGNALKDGKAEFGAIKKATGMELAKVIHYAHNQNKMASLIEEKGWTGASYEMANKYNFAYVTSQNTVSRGLALKYTVKVFWDKDMSEYDAGQFLKKHDVIHGVKGNGVIDTVYLGKNLSRPEMAKIVFNSATKSGIDNAVKRKLSYIRHIPNDDTIELDEGKEKFSNRKSTEIIQPDVIQPSSKINLNSQEDKKEEKKRINDNISSVEENGSPYVTKESTNPTAVTLSILGLNKAKDNKGEKLEDKSVTELEDTLKATSLSNATENDIKEGDLIFMTDENSGQQTTGIVTKSKKIIITTGVK
jgi:hypothetical protein